jgi:hypothetical protein
METLQALKSKINVEKKEEGYVLDWVVGQEASSAVSADSDTSFRNRSVSLSV